LPKEPAYYAGCNEALLRAVPESAWRVLDVGCAEGRLAAAVKGLRPDREVFGIEREPEVALRAAARIDSVFTIDVEAESPPLEQGSIDCILFGDVHEHMVDPEGVLRRLRPLLQPHGEILCSIPNLQHHSMLTALLTGDFQYADAGLLDATHLRFFTIATMLKLLLDAGLAPSIVDTIQVPSPPGLLTAAEPLLDHLGLHRGRLAHYLSIYQYILRGRPMAESDLEPEPDPADTVPVSVICCVQDRETLAANLLASPDLRPGSTHQVILLQDCPDAATGLATGLARAKHELVIWAHQDVYMPRGFIARLSRRLRQAERRWGRIGVAGVYGAMQTAQGPRRVGRVVDRDRLLDEAVDLPALVSALDELLLDLPRDTPLRAEPRLGFHLYGTDLCLQARARRLPAVVLDAICLHNSRHVDLPREFWTSADALAAKWPDALPVATPCVMIGPGT
jgi:SAM-dependent methyltransferase